MNAVILRVGADVGLWTARQFVEQLRDGGFPDAEGAQVYGAIDPARQASRDARERLLPPHADHLSWYARHGDDHRIVDPGQPSGRCADWIGQNLDARNNPGLLGVSPGHFQSALREELPDTRDERLIDSWGFAGEGADG